SASPLLGPFTVMSLLALFVVLFHPAGRSLLRLDRVEPIDRPLALLYLVGAGPLLVYAGLETAKQLGPVDEHVAFVHFGGMAAGGLFIVLMGALAVLRERDRRYATWSTGLIAVFLGLVSVRYPASESSLGVIGGVLLVLWAVPFVAVILSRRRGAPELRQPIDEPAPEST
ncbi:MAG: hypothetical protein R3324_04345, partial [Halobacteriales archaeon]|nr:hypothetical protein [Halobacteriales archaeon]